MAIVVGCVGQHDRMGRRMGQIEATAQGVAELVMQRDPGTQGEQ